MEISSASNDIRKEEYCVGCPDNCRCWKKHEKSPHCGTWYSGEFLEKSEKGSEEYKESMWEWCNVQNYERKEQPRGRLIEQFVLSVSQEDVQGIKNTEQDKSKRAVHWRGSCGKCSGVLEEDEDIQPLSDKKTLEHTISKRQRDEQYISARFRETLDEVGGEACYERVRIHKACKCGCKPCAGERHATVINNDQNERYLAQTSEEKKHYVPTTDSYIEGCLCKDDELRKSGGRQLTITENQLPINTDYIRADRAYQELRNSLARQELRTSGGRQPTIRQNQLPQNIVHSNDNDNAAIQDLRSDSGRQPTFRQSQLPQNIGSEGRQPTFRQSPLPQHIDNGDRQPTIRQGQLPQNIDNGGRQPTTRQSQLPQNVDSGGRQPTFRQSQLPQDIDNGVRQPTIRQDQLPQNIDNRDRQPTIRQSHLPQNIVKNNDNDNVAYQEIKTSSGRQPTITENQLPINADHSRGDSVYQELRKSDGHQRALTENQLPINADHNRENVTSPELKKCCRRQVMIRDNQPPTSTDHNRNNNAYHELRNSSGPKPTIRQSYLPQNTDYNSDNFTRQELNTNGDRQPMFRQSQIPQNIDQNSNNSNFAQQELSISGDRQPTIRQSQLPQNLDNNSNNNNFARQELRTSGDRQPTIRPSHLPQNVIQNNDNVPYQELRKSGDRQPTIADNYPPTNAGRSSYQEPEICCSRPPTITENQLPTNAVHNRGNVPCQGVKYCEAKDADHKTGNSIDQDLRKSYRQPMIEEKHTDNRDKVISQELRKSDGHNSHKPTMAEHHMPVNADNNRDESSCCPHQATAEENRLSINENQNADDEICQRKCCEHRLNITENQQSINENPNEDDRTCQRKCCEHRLNMTENQQSTNADRNRVDVASQKSQKYSGYQSTIKENQLPVTSDHNRHDVSYQELTKNYNRQPTTWEKQGRIETDHNHEFKPNYRSKAENKTHLPASADYENADFDQEFGNEPRQTRIRTKQIPIRDLEEIATSKQKHCGKKCTCRGDKHQPRPWQELPFASLIGPPQRPINTEQIPRKNYDHQTTSEFNYAPKDELEGILNTEKKIKKKTGYPTNIKKATVHYRESKLYHDKLPTIEMSQMSVLSDNWKIEPATDPELIHHRHNNYPLNDDGKSPKILDEPPVDYRELRISNDRQPRTRVNCLPADEHWDEMAACSPSKRKSYDRRPHMRQEQPLAYDERCENRYRNQPNTDNESPQFTLAHRGFRQGYEEEFKSSNRHHDYEPFAAHRQSKGHYSRHTKNGKDYIPVPNDWDEFTGVSKDLKSGHNNFHNSLGNMLLPKDRRKTVITNHRKPPIPDVLNGTTASDHHHHRNYPSNLEREPSGLHENREKTIRHHYNYPPNLRREPSRLYENQKDATRHRNPSNSKREPSRLCENQEEATVNYRGPRNSYIRQITIKKNQTPDHEKWDESPDTDPRYNKYLPNSESESSLLTKNDAATATRGYYQPRDADSLEQECYDHQLRTAPGVEQELKRYSRRSKNYVPKTDRKISQPPKNWDTSDTDYQRPRSNTNRQTRIDENQILLTGNWDETLPFDRKSKKYHHNHDQYTTNNEPDPSTSFEDFEDTTAISRLPNNRKSMIENKQMPAMKKKNGAPAVNHEPKKNFGYHNNYMPSTESQSSLTSKSWDTATKEYQEKKIIPQPMINKGQMTISKQHGRSLEDYPPTIEASSKQPNGDWEISTTDYPRSKNCYSSSPRHKEVSVAEDWILTSGDDQESETCSSDLERNNCNDEMEMLKIVENCGSIAITEKGGKEFCGNKCCHHHNNCQELEEVWEITDSDDQEFSKFCDHGTSKFCGKKCCRHQNYRLSSHHQSSIFHHLKSTASQVKLPTKSLMENIPVRRCDIKSSSSQSSSNDTSS